MQEPKGQQGKGQSPDYGACPKQKRGLIPNSTEDAAGSGGAPA